LDTSAAIAMPNIEINAAPRLLRQRRGV